MIKLFYPRGSGGSWLGNLIWHLENNDFTIPLVDVTFDHLLRSKNIQMCHAFEIFDPLVPTNITYAPKADINLLFSTEYLFSHYINCAIKVKYHIDKLNTRPLYKQLFELSNTARYYFSDQHYYDQYCKNIDLDYRLIFQNPNAFADQLFNLLDRLDIKYAANKNYALDSMNYYRSTCPVQADHFGNLESLLWLGCCHAIILMDNLQFDHTITSDLTLDTMISFFEPFSAYCENRIRPMIF